MGISSMPYKEWIGGAMVEPPSEAGATDAPVDVGGFDSPP